MTDESAENRPKSKDIKPLKTLIPFIKPYWRMIVAALIALVVAASATLTLPYTIRHMIDLGFSIENAATIDRYFIAVFFVVLLMAIFSSLRFYFVSRLGERVVADIRNKLFSRLMHLEPAYYEETSTGEILSRLTTDTTLIQSIVGSSASIALRNLATLIGSLILMSITSPKLSGLMALGIPAIVLPIILFGRRVRRLSRLTQDKIADTSAFASERINAVATVQAFTRVASEITRFHATVEKSFIIAMQRILMRSFMAMAVIILAVGGIVAVLWIGAKSVLSGSMSVGELSQFVLYSILASASTGVLSEVWGELQRAAGAMERITELLNVTPKIYAPPQPASLPDRNKSQISFNNVTFHYPSRPEYAALKDFSLQINPGETIALVGPSGAGKTTVLQLLMRFYDPDAGAILFDDIDIRTVDPDDLREHLGIVPQHAVIFAASARENILFGKPNASESDLNSAAKAAAIHDFILTTEKGYDTFLGERGLRLSGGQQQRIAIARAILRNPPLLLLDEATSSLDAQNEREIQKALEHLLKNRTSIVIAHRLATVKKADRIIVMDDGKIVDSGTHEQLLEAGGLYAKLAKLQFNQ